MVVPSAILVHVVAEALSLGARADSPAFLLRHAYLLVVLGASVWGFGRTIGAGRDAAEMRRRCALVRARFRGREAAATLGVLAGSEALFFALTQLCEGIPMAQGQLATGIIAGLLGSLVAAAAILLAGRSLAGGAVARPIAARVRRLRVRAARSVARSYTPRTADRSFTLCIPNRPPPGASLA